MLENDLKVVRTLELKGRSRPSPMREALLPQELPCSSLSTRTQADSPGRAKLNPRTVIRNEQARYMHKTTTEDKGGE